MRQPSRRSGVNGSEESGGLVTWSGHSSTVIELDGVRIVTDPVYRRRVAHLRRQVAHQPRAMAATEQEPDAILVSHRHFDHLDLPTLRGFGRDVRIVTGPGSGRTLARKGFRRVEELPVGASVAVGPVTVTAVPAEHDGNRHPFDRGGEAVGFLVEGSHRIYFAGDTDLYERMGTDLLDVDLALMPVWGWGHSLGPGHMDPERAAEATGLIKPRLVVPVHWGTLFPIGMARWGRQHLVRPPQEFARLVPDYSPETEVRLLAPGESTSLADVSD